VSDPRAPIDPNDRPAGIVKRPTTPRIRTARMLLGMLAAMLALTVVASCGGARNSLGTPSSACFRALPAAQDAVQRKGKLVGVRKISTHNLQKRLPADTKLAAVKSKDLCAFAFHGTYTPSDVPLATNKRSGSYAIVCVTVGSRQVVAAFILDRTPTRFTHLK
jgi:hypothetical protein